MGTWINAVKDPVIVRVLSTVGLDYILIDMEHSGIDITDVSLMCMLARECGLYPMVRPWEPEDLKMNGRLMDAGAMGLVVPHIKSAAQVKLIADSIRYFDGGTRGYSSRSAASDFLSVNADSMRESDEEVTCIVQFESIDAICQADDIMSVKGVDAAIVGRGDLAHEMGLSGDIENDRVEDAVRRVYEAAEKSGKLKGLLINDFASGDKWINEGIRLLTFSSELNILINGYKEGLARLGEIIAAYEQRNGGLA